MTFDKLSVGRWMRRNAYLHKDPLTGEINATALAEAAADAFDVKDAGGPLDDETHWIWELAAQH